jgi:ATP-dependent protease ClpP protease subunit
MEPKIKYKLDHTLRVKSEDLIYHLHEFDLDLNSNHIYLMGVDRGYDVAGIDEPGIEYMISKRFIKNINLCMRTNPGQPVIIHMKTCGGFWEEGMAIYDAIKSCPSKVTILNYTHARSMSSLIFQAADKRVMMPHSYFMFHDGTYAIEGTVKQVYSSIDFDKKNSKIMLDIYAEKMNEKGEWAGKGITKIKKWLRDQMDRKEDVFLTADQTVELGLADGIFNYDWSELSNY